MSDATPRLLLVDDDAAVLTLLKHRLEATGRFQVHTADGGRAALREIPRLQPDLVVSDVDMPGMDGGSLAAALRATPALAEVPVVFLSSLVDPRSSGQEIGGWPMLSKRTPFADIVATLDRLLAARRAERRSAVEDEVAARTAELLAEKAALEQAAVSDPLTALLNRRGFLARAAEEEARFRRSGRPFSVIIGDVDHFKAVNDTHGHEVGDRVLVAVARAWVAAVRKGDVVGRWGGEELVVLAPDAAGEAAAALADKLRRTVEQLELAAGGGALELTMTLGWATVDAAGGVEECLRAADRALYEGKRSGRNRVVGPSPD